MSTKPGCAWVTADLVALPQALGLRADVASNRFAFTDEMETTLGDAAWENDDAGH